MKMNIKNIKLNYVDYGTNEAGTILLLHGWGQNIEMMKPLGDAYAENYRILIMDLPGFGDSTEPDYAWDVPDYVELVYEFLKNLDFKFVVAKDYQEYIMEIFETKFKEYVPEKHQNDIQYLDTLNFRGFVYYFLLEKWFVEPNIYFYNNTSEEDEDIYWIDHNDNGETLFTPYEPYNEGKTFLGWYTEKECINEWNFDTKIDLGENEVLNLYAKWG